MQLNGFLIHAQAKCCSCFWGAAGGGGCAGLWIWAGFPASGHWAGEDHEVKSSLPLPHWFLRRQEAGVDRLLSGQEARSPVCFKGATDGRRAPAGWANLTLRTWDLAPSWAAGLLSVPKGSCASLAWGRQGPLFSPRGLRPPLSTKGCPGPRRAAPPGSPAPLEGLSLGFEAFVVLGILCSDTAAAADPERSPVNQVSHLPNSHFQAAPPSSSQS